MTHVIVKGKHTGKHSYKQQWKHKHSPYSFVWHRVLGKEHFDTGKLYKATWAIIDTDLPGTSWICLIMNYMKRPVNAVDEHAVHPREVDMPNRVLAVRATAGSMQPLGLFDSVHVRKYILSLDPKHTIPTHWSASVYWRSLLMEGCWNWGRLWRYVVL